MEPTAPGPGPRSPRARRPAVAALLNGLLPGLGLAYCSSELVLPGLATWLSTLVGWAAWAEADLHGFGRGLATLAVVLLLASQAGTAWMLAETVNRRQAAAGPVTIVPAPFRAGAVLCGACDHPNPHGSRRCGRCGAEVHTAAPSGPEPAPRRPPHG